MSGPQTQHKGVVYLLTYCTSQAHALARAGLRAVMVGPTDRPHPHPGPKPSSAPTRARARARAPTSTRARPTTTATRSRTSSAWSGGCERRARRRGAPTWARGWTAFARFSSRKKKLSRVCAKRPRLPPRNCIAPPTQRVLHPPLRSRRGASSASCRRQRSRRPSVFGSPERRIRCPPAFRPRRLRLRRRRRCSLLGQRRRCSLLGLQRRCSSLGLQHRCGSPARPTLTRARRRRLHRRVTSTRSSRR